MRKKLLIGLLAASMALTAVIGLTACDFGGDDGNDEGSGDQTQTEPTKPNGGDEKPSNEHTHSFTQEVAKAKYLKSAATCTEKAVYYKSCKCGETGIATFEYGQPNGHAYTKEIAEAKYLKSAATCTKKAVYYKSCECGGIGTGEFEWGDFIPHVEAIDEAEEATCTTDGKTEGKHCSVCDTVLLKQVVIPAGHKWNIDNVCTVCNTDYYTEGLNFTLKSDNTYEVFGASTASGDIVIPFFYEGLPVTSIRNDAFRERRGITSITIPNSVTSIGEQAFRYCSRLTSVTIPNSVTSIGWGAFSFCRLTSVTIPNSVTSIGHSMFCGCSSLTSVTIPDSVTSIRGGMFEGCSGLTSITIPDGVTSIEGNAFYGCSGLTSITIPDRVTSIEYDAFGKCSGLTSITIPNGVTSIGERAFRDCSGLTSITIPNSVTSIGDGAFRGSGLTSITIPNGVTIIGDLAFCDCSGLTSIMIPNSVTSIGMAAFYKCSEFTNIWFKGTKKEWEAISKGDYWNANTGNYTVQCDDGKLEEKGEEIELE